MDDNEIDTRVQGQGKTTFDARSLIDDFVKRVPGLYEHFKVPQFDLPSMDPPSFTKTIDPEMFLPPTTQLIVLGNGFDLESGLKSRFRDFFRSRRKPLKQFFDMHTEINNSSDISLFSTMQENTLNVWDIILYSVSNTNWCDVESIIGEWVIRQNPSSPEESKFTGLFGLLKSFGKNQENNNRIIRKNLENKEILYTAYYLFELNNSAKVKNESQLYGLLLSELHRLEDVFKQYLISITDDNISYIGNAKKLFLTLFCDEISDEDAKNLGTAVLDFNYTNPIPHAAWGDNLTLVNIHGDLHDKHIVFGIDGKEHMDDAETVRFTKTYRLLEFDNPDRAKLIQTKTQGGMDNSTNIIKFYGHSLNEADYSYFQAIFDGVDLYESHTRLIFYYRPPKLQRGEASKFEAEVQQDMFHKVTKLLNTYGDTMRENPDHGKNLMHKLLLEGRLSVKRFRYQNEH